MQYGIYSYLFHLVLPRWKGQSPETWDSLILCILVCSIPIVNTNSNTAQGIIYATFKNWRFDTIWIGLLCR